MKLYNNLASVQRAILVDPAQITNVSSPEKCRQAARALEDYLREWFQHPSIAQLRVYVEEEVSKTESDFFIWKSLRYVCPRHPTFRNPIPHLGKSYGICVKLQSFFGMMFCSDPRPTSCLSM